ncbi:protein of unknown function (DUF1707) [Micromonospora narathiwatensis]|uniref:Outer membrane protein assembly factor BamB, contains PQQ-like beta-propeller repeat n=1 Tax=Micromonospora narathiwatensis TaxID=299146 RepID=A0A1A8ZTG7_9ACTN|nr:protein of unknown function (DUF1707) [Micromonospora narathiwatensis]
MLQMALREGRLDAVEFDSRSRAGESARYVDELDALVADLPRQLGVRDWAASLRVRATDRDLAIRWLADALAEGRLTPEQHERRLAGLAGAETYADLRGLLDGVPGPPSATRKKLLVSAGDREATLDRLSQAFADGMLTADEHAELRTSAQRATRYRDLDQVAAGLAGRAGTTDRARAVRRLDQAHADGRLNAAEHAERVRAANAATREDELARLLDDLPGRAPTRSLLSSVRRYRLSDTERDQAVQELQQALNDGQLTLDEYDERTRAAYAAQAARELKPLLADIIEPEPSRRAAGAADPVENRTVGRRRVAIAAVVVGCLALGVGGLVWHGGGKQQREQGDTSHAVHVLWSAPVDRPSTVKGVGNWVAGDTVIRARTDKVVAYQLADGQVSWTFQLPARQQVCAMSRTTEGGIGLIAYSPDGEYRCATLVALDVTNGRLLWHRETRIPPEIFRWYGGSEEFALTTETAVIKEPTGFVAVDARENKPRWRLPAARGCEPYSVAAGGGVAALLSTCEGRTARLTVVDLASGRERWHAQLQTSDTDERYLWTGNGTVVLSLDPLVIRVSDEDGRGGAFVSFDAHGARRATILQSQEEFDVAGSFPSAFLATMFEARSAYPVAVVGDTLVAPVTRAGDERPSHVAAFSLTDGRRLWLTDLGDLVEAITAADGNILVKTGGEVVLLTPQDGRKTERHDLDEILGESAWIDELRAVGQRWVFLRVDGTKSNPAVMVLG